MSVNRNSWSVYTYESGATWVADGSIYVPNQDLPIGKSSRLNPVILADGSIGTMTPSTKFVNDVLNFVWLNIDDTDTIITKIEDYIEDTTYIKIVTDLAEEYIGTFTSLQRARIVGLDAVSDLNASFLRH